MDCLVHIDNLGLFYYPTDLPANGTTPSFDMGYGKSQSAQLLLDLEYNQVRKELSHLLLRRAHWDIADILITTEDGDSFHMTEKLLRILTEEKSFLGICYRVIRAVGLISISGSILLYDASKDMWKIMGDVYGCIHRRGH